MTGAAAVGSAETATNCVAGVSPQAFSALSATSSITAKSASAALSVTTTRTVASAGSSVKLTWRSACQGADPISRVSLPTAIQGRGLSNDSTPATTTPATKGIAESRILKRNMTDTHSNTSPEHRVYGWQSVKTTRYRLVDGKQKPATRVTPRASRPLPARDRTRLRPD